jgi:hypothetical protein
MLGVMPVKNRESAAGIGRGSTCRNSVFAGIGPTVPVSRM